MLLYGAGYVYMSALDYYNRIFSSYVAMIVVVKMIKRLVVPK